jgi:hypothetical protein
MASKKRKPKCKTKPKTEEPKKIKPSKKTIKKTQNKKTTIIRHTNPRSNTCTSCKSVFGKIVL